MLKRLALSSAVAGERVGVGTRVTVGVAGTRVAVGGMRVAVTGTRVEVGGMGVGGTGVSEGAGGQPCVNSIRENPTR